MSSAPPDISSERAAHEPAADPVRGSGASPAPDAVQALPEELRDKNMPFVGPAEYALLQAGYDLAFAENRGAVAIDDLNRIFRNTAIPEAARLSLLRDMQALAPPGWQDAAPPVAGRSLTALSPTPGRALAALLAATALPVFLALLTLPEEGPLVENVSSGDFPAVTAD